MTMRFSSLCLVFVLFGTALTFLRLSTASNGFSVTDGHLNSRDGSMANRARGRQLKGNLHTTPGRPHKKGSVDVQDYSPMDPVPGSKASIKPGPINHGTPLIPFIPKPPPPDISQHGGGGGD